MPEGHADWQELASIVPWKCCPKGPARAKTALRDPARSTRGRAYPPPILRTIADAHSLSQQCFLGIRISIKKRLLFMPAWLLV